MADCVHDMPIEWCALCKPPAEVGAAKSSAISPGAPGEMPVEQHPEVYANSKRYFEWNEAIAREVFGSLRPHVPVYLDIEDDVLLAAAASLGLEADPAVAERDLARAAKQTLWLDRLAPKNAALEWHVKRLKFWQRSQTQAARLDDPPPVVALLALFSRAADRMGQDAVFTAHAYYPRLTEVFDVDADGGDRLETSYRRDSERLWGALARWIEDQEGNAGRATIEPLGHRYVGLAISQALIRAADRRRLLERFAEVHLEPGLELTSGDMKSFLDPWIKSGHASSSLSRLWSTNAGKDVVAEAAVQALREWDGTRTGNEHEPEIVGAPPLLTATIRKRLGASAVQLSIAVPGSLSDASASSEVWNVASAGEGVAVEMEPLADRLLAPVNIPDADARGLLEGKLVLSREAPGVVERRTRSPKPLVVLRHVPEAGLYVEVDRPRLGERHLLLYSTRVPRFQAPRGDLMALLERIAQPGFVGPEQLPGVPEGWAVLRNVVIVRSQDGGDLLLDPLQPIQSQSLAFDGGLRLPGRARRWHADIPITIRATARDADSMTLTITREDEDRQVKTWHVDASEFEFSTAALLLTTGDYRVELESKSKGKASTTSARFSLVDSDSGGTLRPPVRSLSYVPASVLGALSAWPPESLPFGERPPHSTTPASAPGPAWWSQRASEKIQPTLTRSVSGDSCVFTGRHKERIENGDRGEKDRGECEYCHRVKYYSKTGRLKVDLSAVHQVTRPLASSQLAAQSTVTGDVLLDAIVLEGAGTVARISRLISQVDDRPHALDTALRDLEVTGHLRIERDARTWSAVAWEVEPPALAGLANGDWLLVGAWTKSARAALESAVRQHGANVEVDESDWIYRRTITGLDLTYVVQIASAMEVKVVPDAGAALLRELVPLTRAEAELIKVSAEGVFDGDRFHPQTVEWLQVATIAAPGGYRLSKGFSSEYYIRGPHDVEHVALRRGDPRTVKHLASRARPLIGYDSSTKRLIVPLGADLPALYGRALCLMGGKPPRRVEGTALVAYTNVDELSAATIHALLGDPR
jgi:hypothetical protein